MTDPLANKPLPAPDTPEETAWNDGFDAGRSSIMVGWKLQPIDKVVQYGDVLYGVSDQVDEPLVKIMGDRIGAQIGETIIQLLTREELIARSGFKPAKTA